MQHDRALSDRHRTVFIGLGTGGLSCARALSRTDVEVTLIGRTNHHVFQPLLYQVATGVLSGSEIAASTRMLLRKHRNTQVIIGDVTAIDLSTRTVASRTADGTTVTA